MTWVLENVILADSQIGSKKNGYRNRRFLDPQIILYLAILNHPWLRPLLLLIHFQSVTEGFIDFDRKLKLSN